MENGEWGVGNGEVISNPGYSSPLSYGTVRRSIAFWAARIVRGDAPYFY